MHVFFFLVLGSMIVNGAFQGVGYGGMEKKRGELLHVSPG